MLVNTGVKPSNLASLFNTHIYCLFGLRGGNEIVKLAEEEIE